MAKRSGRRTNYRGSLRLRRVFDTAHSASILLVLFIPSHERLGAPIDQDVWVDEALRVLGALFNGATAFPRGKGVWRDDEREGELIFDEPVIVHCYASERLLEKNARALREFLVRMGTECRQGAVGFVINDDYFEIRFPLN